MSREHLDDPRLDRLQLRLAALEKRISRIPFADGALVEDEAIGTSATLIAHRLGRAPKGVLVLKASPDSALGFSATQPNETTVYVNLEASIAATFTLWFW